MSADQEMKKMLSRVLAYLDDRAHTEEHLRRQLHDANNTIASRERSNRETNRHWEQVVAGLRKELNARLGSEK